ncbi:hypothetical protein SAMN05660841_03982 [Sphingobacterium nematocida]|uniref:Uncharacterized protein n=1 Tax=Sphingobacterium nematocida TaxID=1513896 RepID=A0A1T5GE10_9SPHI|nr:DUF6266 family protein [Sphingobacterium nematocida]SKC06655.1 hypothetical protein SAMN05660841_03982 [Sphingobacterium nematocida]
MARFLKGIVGAYSGKVGSVVGSNWRSVDYVRSVARRSNKAASEDQLAQRARFALGVGFLSPIKDLLNLGYSDPLQGRSTGYNKALQHLLSYGVIGTYPSLELDYGSIVVAKGALSNLLGVAWTESAPQEISVSWSTEVNRFNAFADDSVILLMYNKEKRFFSILESATRNDGTMSFNFPPVYAGDHVVGWVFTGHRDGVKTSGSYYLGEIVVS